MLKSTVPGVVPGGHQRPLAPASAPKAFLSADAGFGADERQGRGRLLASHARVPGFESLIDTGVTEGPATDYVGGAFARLAFRTAAVSQPL